MIYLPPFAVQGTHLLTETQLVRHASLYHALLERLSQGNFSLELMRGFPLLNDWLDQDSGATDA